MKRPPEGAGGGPESGSKLEAVLSRFLERHPRFLLYCAIGLGVLIVIALVAAKFSGGGQ